jgi:hypothetical protein
MGGIEHLAILRSGSRLEGEGPRPVVALHRKISVPGTEVGGFWQVAHGADILITVWLG